MASAPPGMILGHSLNLYNRPEVENPETGGTSTLYSTSVNLDGEEVLIPRVSQDGRFLTEDEAVDEYLKTNQHLGKFRTPDSASHYANLLHQHQAVQGGEQPPQDVAGLLRLWFGNP